MCVMPVLEKGAQFLIIGIHFITVSDEQRVKLASQVVDGEI